MRGTGRVRGASPSFEVLSRDIAAPQESISHSPRFFSLGLFQRIGLFVLLFVLEWAPLTNLVHKGRGAGSLLQIAIAFCSFFLAFAYFRFKPSFRRISNELSSRPIDWRLLAIHLFALTAFVALSFVSSSKSVAGFGVAVLWYASGVLAIGLAACAFVPATTVLELLRSTGTSWIFALAASVIAWMSVITFGFGNGFVWNPAID